VSEVGFQGKGVWHEACSSDRRSKPFAYYSYCGAYTETTPSDPPEQFLACKGCERSKNKGTRDEWPRPIIARPHGMDQKTHVWAWVNQAELVPICKPKSTPVERMNMGQEHYSDCGACRAIGKKFGA